MNLRIIFISIINIFKLSLFKAAFRKIFSRGKVVATKEATDFYQKNSIDIRDFYQKKDIPDDESFFSDEMKDIVNDHQKLKSEGTFSQRKKMGGFGLLGLISHYVSKFQPKLALETGVSYGASSFIILDEMYKYNAKAKLYSNDLPYLWQEEPLKNLGILVPERYRENWELSIGDDLDNLNKILDKIPSLEFCHYDSNKSYEGFKYFWSMVEAKLSESAVVIFDDIHGNNFFFDFHKCEHKHYELTIIKAPDKFVGVIEKIGRIS